MSSFTLKFQVFIKVLLLLVFFGGASYLVFGGDFSGFLGQRKKTVTSDQGKLTFEAPYKNAIDSNLGLIQDARIVLPIKTVNGFENKTFLLDSGATVSTLPISETENLGIDLNNSKRIALKGFSGAPTFAYLDNITLRIGDLDFNLPATFTDVNKSSYILGRKGLFDDFSINFDREKQIITLIQKDGT